MKKVFSGVLGLSFIGFLLYFSFTQSYSKHTQLVLGSSPTRSITQIITPTNVAVVHEEEKTLFVPYWAINNVEISRNYDRFIYFGIEGNTNGINTSDPGYKNIDMFLKETDTSKKRILTVRMIDSDVNATILGNKQIQRDIATESASIAHDKGFDGVLLDFEISAISFDSVITSINDFVKEFSADVKKNNLSFYMTVYGDSMFRLRPYDISKLDNSVDGFMVMAYDFHKARADAGPNFPLSGKDIYGYDFQSMTTDFLSHALADKLTIVFGMFGYDWQIDNKNQTVGTAKVITTSEAYQKFTTCSLKNCHIYRDAVSAETKVTYLDTDNHLHEVWFEDIPSTEKKTDFLRSKGISAVGYWAYSYF